MYVTANYGMVWLSHSFVYLYIIEVLKIFIDFEADDLAAQDECALLNFKERTFIDGDRELDYNRICCPAGNCLLLDLLREHVER